MRKGGDALFIVKELQAVADPAGGWFGPGVNGKGGKFISSLLSAIDDVMQEHFESIGTIKTETKKGEINT